MGQRPAYDVVVIGGGPAGLTTGLYCTRLGHRTAVFEATGGRHTAVADVHNLFGVSEDVSGAQLAELATRQLEEYGGDLYPDVVEAVSRAGDGARFRVDASRAAVAADRVVFATGFTDDGPDVPDLRRFTGRGLHYCLHCDAYTLGDGSVFVMGHDESAAHVAMVMLNFTADVDLLLDGEDPQWSDETERQLRAHPVDRVDSGVVSAFPEDPGAAQPWLGGLEFAEGTEREYLGGFAMYGREYNTDLAESLDCALSEDGALAVDDTFETSVDGAYAVGDVTHGQNQTPTALADGARAGIAIHKSLRRFPVAADELADEGAVDLSDPAEADLDAPAAPADLRARMRRLRQRTTHAGLRKPRPDDE